MDQNNNPQRMDAIFNMLLEMAGGNFNGQLPVTGDDDSLSALSILINMLAEEMKASVFHTGFINPRFTYRYLIHAGLLLDEHFTVEGFNPYVPAFLGYTPPALYRTALQDLLAPASYEAFREAKAAAGDEQDFNRTLELTFLRKDGLEVPALCTFSRLLYTGKLLVSSITIIAGAGAGGDSNRGMAVEGVSHTQEEAQLVKNVHDYILAHLEEPMLPARELARLFGTNEFTLKKSFKQALRTSLYKFYNSERLGRACLLIRETDTPLSAIAQAVGFNTYPNFSKAFRKVYGYSPADARKGQPGSI